MESEQAARLPTTPSETQAHLLRLIEARELDVLSEFLSHRLSQLPAGIRQGYTARSSLEHPFSAPAQLLLAATKADEPEAFQLLWGTLYAPHAVIDGETAPKVPYECLRQAARTGSIDLARTFLRCDPSSLTQGPPPVVRGRRTGSQIITALFTRQFAYIDFMLAQGVELDHDWPRVRVLRTAIGLEQSDEGLVALVRWLVDRGVRIRGSGALRKLAGYGDVEAVTILLDAGANVEDLEEDGEEDEQVEAAIMAAVRAGHVEMVRLLVSRGADAGRSNSKGETPVSLAEAGRQESILAELRKVN